jgi:O-antigen/teichoic acid export membrane protein
LAYIIISTLIASSFSIVYYFCNNNWGKLWNKIDLRFIFKSYKSGFRVFLSTLFIILLIRFDIVIIKRMLGFSQVGIYSIAAHIIDLLQIASNLVGGLLLVKLSDKTDDIEKWLIMKKLLMAFCIMLAIANIGFVICGKFILSIMFGIQFVPVYYVYLWLIPASFGLSFGSLFNMYLNSKGFPVISIILPAVSLAVNVIMNIILIPVMGIYGSALATSVAYILWFVMIIAYEQYCSSNQMLMHLIPNKDDWYSFWRETLILIEDIRRKLPALNKRIDKQ